MPKPTNADIEEPTFDDIEEAFRLLDLINMEFRSDPLSTQCFDLRIVERVNTLVNKVKDKPNVNQPTPSNS